jgi:translation initiation factor 2 subunit 3
MVQFYNKSYPDKGDLLVCRINSIQNDSGYMVELLEYDNLTGFVCLKEITQAKWFRNLRSMASEGDIEVMQVIAIGEKGDIDLSRRYIPDEAKEDILSRYKMWKRVYDYLLFMVSNEHQEFIINKLLHPYIEYLENVQKMNEESDEETDSSKLQLESISTWLEKYNDSMNNSINDSIRDILFHVIKLVEKPTNLKIQTGTVQLKLLSRIRVGQLNLIIKHLAENCNVHIRTYNTKTSNFQVTSKDKLTIDQFNDLLGEIIQKLPEIIKKFSLIEEHEKLNDFDHSNPRNYDHLNHLHQPLLNIGIVGHVAHGKTTLIEAISGVDTRRYKKEISTNRTLNIGYTNATVYKCHCNNVPMYLTKQNIPAHCKCDHVTVSIVDCPGHNVLLSTMITGAQIMDTCILVVSADETCPQPQTNEHIAVLEIIGEIHKKSNFSNGLVLQNKVDLVSTERAKESYTEICKFTSGTILDGLNILPISAQMQINTEKVLEFIYEYAKSKTENNEVDNVKNNSINNDIQIKDNEQEQNHSKGIIVRTFDINKPGSDRILGAVIGGSIMNGEFSIAEEILILPLAIQAKILSMKTEKYDLDVARPGGLIAIQTDINPAFCSLLIGCTFIKIKDYVPERLLKTETPIKFKYNLLHKCGIERLRKEDRVTLNYSGGNIDAIVTKSLKDKNRGTLSLLKPIYLFPNENGFTLIVKQRLVGFGLIHNGNDVKKTKICRKLNDTKLELPIITYPKYEELLDNFTCRLLEWKETSIAKIRIPVPKTLYKFTFTTIVNFGNIADSLNVTTDELGSYIYQELGCKSWSVNGQRQLLLKGRTDERKVMSVLQHFVIEKRCMLCRQNSVKTIKNMGVKQRVCTKCSWKA